MSEAKAEILRRIREATADGPVADPVQRTYRRTSSRDRAEVVEMLRDRLIDYRASVRDETEETVAAAIAELLGPDARYVVPAGLEPDWLPADSRGAGRERITEPAVGHTGERAAVRGAHDGEREPLSVDALNEVDAVVTSSTVSCAETGTIFLSGRPDEGRRAITLVPDHHVCIVPLDSVVELFPEALARVEATAPITMVSGPSATSDIELERVEGVHGPRRLDVILLDRAG